MTIGHYLHEDDILESADFKSKFDDSNSIYGFELHIPPICENCYVLYVTPIRHLFFNKNGKELIITGDCAFANFRDKKENRSIFLEKLIRKISKDKTLIRFNFTELGEEHYYL